MAGASCLICGRALTNPDSIAAGTGPICGGRGYLSRVTARHKNSSGGWKDITHWEAFNNPCYTCEHFKVPGKNQEIEQYDGNIVCMNDLVKEFPPEAIGGYCKHLEMLVDGNQIKSRSSCLGKNFSMRSDKKRQIQAVLEIEGQQKIEITIDTR